VSFNSFYRQREVQSSRYIFPPPPPMRCMKESEQLFSACGMWNSIFAVSRLFIYFYTSTSHYFTRVTNIYRSNYKELTYTEIYGRTKKEKGTRNRTTHQQDLDPLIAAIYTVQTRKAVYKIQLGIFSVPLTP
jgi:hypothetical protein